MGSAWGEGWSVASAWGLLDGSSCAEARASLAGWSDGKDGEEMGAGVGWLVWGDGSVTGWSCGLVSSFAEITVGEEVG